MHYGVKLTYFFLDVTVSISNVELYGNNMGFFVVAFVIVAVVVLIAVNISHEIDGFLHRADSRFVPSQWETALLCNDVSHWLGANLELALFT